MRDDKAENAKVFEFAVDYVNANNEHKLEAVVKDITFGNEFEASRNICSLVEVSESKKMRSF